MRKSLVPVGNSLGIIIEKPILELLGMSRESVLEVSTDGRRLIIEPLPGQAQPVVDDHHPQSDATGRVETDFADPKVTVRIVDALVDRFHMDNERFRRLHHARNYENTFKAHRDYAAKRPSRFQTGGTNETTARRLSECLEALKRGETWDTAIQSATRLVPR